MKISQDVREYAARQAQAEAGMAEKSAEFREGGAESSLIGSGGGARDEGGCHTG